MADILHIAAGSSLAGIGMMCCKNTVPIPYIRFIIALIVTCTLSLIGVNTIN